MDPSYNNSFGGNASIGGSGSPMGANGAGMGASLNGVGMGGVGMSTNMGNMTNQPIVGSGTGDIVLSSSGGEKKSKKGLIIGVVCGLVAVVAIVLVVVLMNFGGGSNGGVVSKNVTERWNDYYNLLMIGQGAPVSEAEEDEETDVEEEETTTESETMEVVDINEVTVENWFPVMVDSGNYAGSSSEYYHALADRFNEFYELGEGILADNNNDYVAYVQAFLNYHLIGELENEVLNKYLDEGAEAAEEYIGRFVTENVDADVELLNNRIKEYLEIYLSILERIDISECSENDDRQVCVSLIQLDNNTEELNELFSRKNDAYNYMLDYYNGYFAMVFFSETTDIDKLVEGGA